MGYVRQTIQDIAETRGYIKKHLGKVQAQQFCQQVRVHLENCINTDIDRVFESKLSALPTTQAKFEFLRLLDMVDSFEGLSMESDIETLVAGIRAKHSRQVAEKYTVDSSDLEIKQQYSSLVNNCMNLFEAAEKNFLTTYKQLSSKHMKEFCLWIKKDAKELTKTFCLVVLEERFCNWPIIMIREKVILESIKDLLEFIFKPQERGDFLWFAQMRWFPKYNIFHLAAEIEDANKAQQILNCYLSVHIDKKISNLEVVKMLKEEDAKGYTPLMLAAQYNDFQAFKMLFSLGILAKHYIDKSNLSGLRLKANNSSAIKKSLQEFGVDIENLKTLQSAVDFKNKFKNFFRISLQSVEITLTRSISKLFTPEPPVIFSLLRAGFSDNKTSKQHVVIESLSDSSESSELSYS